MSSSQLAVVIVTWNVRDLALAAIESLFTDLEQSVIQGQVWVVDNASEDGVIAAVQTPLSRSTYD